VTLKEKVEQLANNVVNELLKDYKPTETFSYSKTKILMNKAISAYSIGVAKLVKEQAILDEIENNQKERETKKDVS